VSSCFNYSFRATLGDACKGKLKHEDTKTRRHKEEGTTLSSSFIVHIVISFFIVTRVAILESN